MNNFEYIPLDLVMTKTEPNNFVPNGVVCEFVSYCNRNKVFVRVAKGIDTFFLGKEQITHIPLTSEILKKNGWKKFKRPYSRDYCYRRNGYPTLNICSENEVYFHWGDHNKYITTMHQLQNLLFGLGINHEMEV
jgi:hypothetical protein